MIIPGLVSITFRSLAPEEIIRLAAQAGVQSIEWGGDVHVPAGEVDRAREVGRRTREAGLMVSAYGSSSRLGRGGGGGGEGNWSREDRREIIDDALRVAEMAGRAGIPLSLEYHGGTLTDTRA